MGEKREAYRLLMGKPEGERPRWLVSWIEWGGMDWIWLAQERDEWRR
jgi:hypothetical protein